MVEHPHCLLVEAVSSPTAGEAVGGVTSNPGGFAGEAAVQEGGHGGELGGGAGSKLQQNHRLAFFSPSFFFHRLSVFHHLKPKILSDSVVFFLHKPDIGSV